MAGFIASLLMGLAVGVAYALIGIRSPAPPLVALVGLLGIVLGEQAVGLARHTGPAASAAAGAAAVQATDREARRDPTGGLP
jgi:XapX domain-containing protein